jgi:hypothetical protein
MSRYTYAGDFVNPTTGWVVIPNPNPIRRADDDSIIESFIIGIPITDGEIVQVLRNEGADAANELLALRDKTGGYRPHTSETVFMNEDDATEYIESLEDFFEQDYDDYLEENHFELVRMERYEMWRNEY